MRSKSIYLFVIILSFTIAFFLVYSNNYKYDKPNITNKKHLIIKKKKNKKKNDNIIKIKISAAGDCTIGYDDTFGYGSRFDKIFQDNGNDYNYFFKNVKDIFKDDDITYVNLEGTFTTSNVKVEKKFNFKADPSYVQILKNGNVDIVGVANNHSYDYGEKGFEDTINTLKDNNIDSFGYSNYLIKEIKGIKIGFFGLIDIDARKYGEVDKAINYLKEHNCDLIIGAMHWGIEKDYKQTDAQIKLGHYMIDNGVDLVIGTHPHVIQGIEKYHNKYIIYSLGNFVFGGNSNPADKDTFIYQQTFKFVDNTLIIDDDINIIPASISSVKNKNNYQVSIVDGTDKERVYKKINNYSINFSI